MWGFLEEFWNSIIAVGEYPIAFFENIGKAVAGAVGGLFDFLLHSVSDSFIFLGWLTSNIWVLIEKILSPIRFVITFLKKFVSEAIKTANVEQIWSIPDEILSVFQAIPYWSFLSTALGIGILLIVVRAVIKKLERI